MGYRRISSALHNFAQSFVRQMDHECTGYSHHLLPRLIAQLPNREFRICFPRGSISPPTVVYPLQLRSVVANFCDEFQRRFAGENVDMAVLTRVEVVVYGDPDELQYRAEATDDRGKEYRVVVQ